jgi:PAS domain S-box-containing protein
MLAYQPDLPIGYDLPLTLLSIVAAILITGAGWQIATRETARAAAGGGAVAGSGIAIMHFVGMSAVKVGGQMVWDEALVIASVLIGVAVGALALTYHRLRPSLFPWRPALLFTLAICGLHFTAMASVGIRPDFDHVVPPEAIGGDTLTVGVVAMAAIILSISLVMVVVDRKLARHAAEEAQRIRAFADAAIEGLVVVDGERVVDANRSFLDLSGYAGRDSLPPRLGDLFPQLRPALVPSGAEAKAIESRLVRADASFCDVEVLFRPLTWRGAERHVLAVRDISERKQAEARIAHLAYHDALTGVPNRAVFSEHLARQVERARAASAPSPVLCFDLAG